MKICVECNWHKRAPMQVGPGQTQMVDVCTNLKCRDPVGGEFLPCAVARRDPAFCGIKATHHTIKVEKAASVVSLIHTEK